MVNYHIVAINEFIWEVSFRNVHFERISTIKEQLTQLISSAVILNTMDSIVIKSNASLIEKSEIENKLKVIFNKPSLKLTSPKNHQIPICYHVEFGFDLVEISKKTGRLIKEIIEIHENTEYQIQMFGFAPGFFYATGLSSQLHFSRKATPLKSVKTGSVGIAENMTAIYPFDLPGGWHIVGRCPLRFFNPDEGTFSLLSVGDKIKFYSISRKHFDEINGKDY